MKQWPWDRAQPDEWLPRSLRLCWGGGGGGFGGDGGGGFSGDSGGGWSGDSGGGFGGATTGGGDWGSAGAADFSGSFAGDIGAWGGTAYDASSFSSGTLGGGDWGSFGTTNYSGFDAPNPTFFDVAGPNPGVLTGGGDWGSAGLFSAAGTGGGPAGAMFGADMAAGAGAPGQVSSGLWGDYPSGPSGGSFYGGGGNVFGSQSGSFYGGGGQQGGGSSYGGGGGRSGGGGFGGFGSAGTSSGGRSGGPLGGSNAVAAAPSGGRSFADTTGGGTLTGSTSAGRTTSDAPTRGEAEVESAGPNVDTGRADADADTSDFGTPQTSEAAPQAAPEAEPGPSLSDAAPAGNIGGKDDAAPASAGQGSLPSTSAFGPQSISADYEGAPYADMGSQQSPSSQSYDYSGSPYADMGPAFSQAYTDASQQLSDMTQSVLSGYDYQGSPYADMGGQLTAPDFNQAFQAFEAQPGWDPAEQTAGQPGLVEPTAWAANPYETPGALGRDFNQAFDPFADTPTGMDLAGDLRSENAPLTFNEMWGATPYTTLPNDQLSRSAQETLLHDFSYFPNPGYVQGPPQATLNDQINAIVSPALNAAMYPFARGLDYLAGIPNTTNITDPVTAFSNFAQNTLLGGPNIQSLNPDAIAAFEVGQQGRAGANPDVTDWGSVFEGAAPTEAQPAIEGFIPGGRETNFDYNVAPTQAPINVEVVRSDDPALAGVPGIPQGELTTSPPGTLPPAVEAPEAQPQEAQPIQPQEAQPTQPQEAQPQAPQEAQPAQPQETQPQAPQETQPTQPQEAQPTQPPPGLLDMVPGTPGGQPGQPAAPPQPPPAPDAPAPDNQPDAPEPNDNPNPPGDPNAPRPPGDIPGQVIGQNGQYDNAHADTPQTSRTYRDSGRTDYPQGRPGITFRTARQAGIAPLFRTNGVNTSDLSAQLVENVNRALRAMEQRTGIPANSLAATSGWRPAHRGEAHEHGMDPRTSQESVYSRSNPTRGRHFPAAQPGHSNHAPGTAIDFADSRARAWLRQNAREFGLETLGGTFDMPHIQLRGGGAGQRPSAQEQAEQRALDAQNRQLAQERGLIAPGRGNQQAGVPLPRARPTDVPPAEVPTVSTRLPPLVPQETEPPAAPVAPVAPVDRPPADIPPPAPFLAPPRAGRADPVMLDRAISDITTQALRGIDKNTTKDAAIARGAVARAAMVKAGVPLATARAALLELANQTAARMGYARSDYLGAVGSAIDKGIAEAMQGYQPAAPGPVQGPYGFQPAAPFAPGRQGSLLDFLQNFNPISTAEARGGRSQGGQLTAPRADPGTIQGRLSSVRSNVINDLQTNLGLRNTLDLVVTGEVGSQGKAAVLGFLETAMNKVAAEASRDGRTATGRDLLQYLNDRSYFPDTWGKIESGKIKGGALTDDLLSAIAAGSNITGMSTGNSSATSPGSRFGGNPTNATIGREHYGVENYGHHAAWYNAMGAPEAGRGIGSDYAAGVDDMPAVGFLPSEAPPPDMPMRGLAQGGHVADDEPVVVGEEGPEVFVPDQPGIVLPHMPQPGKKTGNIDRWPKIPAPAYPGRYGGVEREMLRQTRTAQDPVPGLMDMIDSERLRLNLANWNRMISDPGLIALGRSRIEDRRFERDPGY